MMSVLKVLKTASCTVFSELFIIALFIENVAIFFTNLHAHPTEEGGQGNKHSKVLYLPVMK